MRDQNKSLKSGTLNSPLIFHSFDNGTGCTHVLNKLFNSEFSFISLLPVRSLNSAGFQKVPLKNVLSIKSLVCVLVL